MGHGDLCAVPPVSHITESGSRVSRHCKRKRKEQVSLEEQRQEEGGEEGLFLFLFLFLTLCEGGVLLLLDKSVLVLAGLGDEGTSRKLDLGLGKRGEDEENHEGHRKQKAVHRERSISSVLFSGFSFSFSFLWLMMAMIV